VHCQGHWCVSRGQLSNWLVKISLVVPVLRACLLMRQYTSCQRQAALISLVLLLAVSGLHSINSTAGMAAEHEQCMMSHPSDIAKKRDINWQSAKECTPKMAQMGNLQVEGERGDNKLYKPPFPPLCPLHFIHFLHCPPAFGSILHCFLPFSLGQATVGSQDTFGMSLCPVPPKISSFGKKSRRGADSPATAIP
jgi:hypothetical protein